ncbi:MAG TPA: RNA polymerase sigma factor [candidate division Zixibacteria bacterium]|nr:RNA polymerase sigma factor [candidate division Zixibacteria bacterium]
MNQEAAKSDYISEVRGPSTSTDRQCLQEILEGDDQALAELYSRYRTGVFNYSLRILGDREAAEDILQEVFVAVWQGASGFRHHSSVKTWIYRIAHNMTVSWIRKQKRITTNIEEVPETQDDPEEASVINWRADEVRSALDQLNPIHRATVELAFVHDLSYAEIGEVLDCPTGTVKSRMSNAIKQLRRILNTRSGLNER